MLLLLLLFIIFFYTFTHTHAHDPHTTHDIQLHFTSKDWRHPRLALRHFTGHFLPRLESFAFPNASPFGRRSFPTGVGKYFTRFVAGSHDVWSVKVTFASKVNKGKSHYLYQLSNLAAFMVTSNSFCALCPWLPLPGRYGCAHALGTCQVVGNLVPRGRDPFGQRQADSGNEILVGVRVSPAFKFNQLVNSPEYTNLSL